MDAEEQVIALQAWTNAVQDFVSGAQVVIGRGVGGPSLTEELDFLEELAGRQHATFLRYLDVCRARSGAADPG